MMQAHSIFIGGLPMIFYGDELGYLNDYSWKEDPGKHYDNRWMHRPLISWEKNALARQPGTLEERIYAAHRKMLAIRRSHEAFSDLKNMRWLTPHNIHVAGYLRQLGKSRIFCLFNFSGADAWLTWYAFREQGSTSGRLRDHWTGAELTIGRDQEHLVIPPYGFMILEEMNGSSPFK
jgi:amylosucrase